MVVGGAAFVVNWGLFKLLRMAGMVSRGEVFFAFLLSTEISILFNFLLQYLWTWKDSTRLRSWSFLRKAGAFHGAVGVGALFRIAFFPMGQFVGLHDDLNFIVGVAIASLLNFVLYDKVVFRGARH